MTLRQGRDNGLANLAAHLSDTAQIEAYARAITDTIHHLQSQTRSIRVLHVGAPFGGALVYHSLSAGADVVDVIDASASMAGYVQSHFIGEPKVRVKQLMSTELEADEPYHLTIMAWAGSLAKMAHMFAHDLVIRQVSLACFIPSEISYALQIRTSSTVNIDRLAVYYPPGCSNGQYMFTVPPTVPAAASNSTQRLLHFESALKYRGTYEVGRPAGSPREYAYARLGVDTARLDVPSVLEHATRLELEADWVSDPTETDLMILDYYTIVLNPIAQSGEHTIHNHPDAGAGGPAPADQLSRRITHPNYICPIADSDRVIRLRLMPRDAGNVAFYQIPAHDKPAPTEFSPYPYNKIVSLLEKTTARVIDTGNYTKFG